MLHAKYTMLLDTLISNNYNLSALNEYPIFNETYRPILNKKILDYYRFFEIGFETPAEFNFKLLTTLNIIMSTYNQYYNIETVKDNIGIDELINIQYREKTDGITLDTTINNFDGQQHSHGENTTASDNTSTINYGKAVHDTGTQNNVSKTDNFLTRTSTDFSDTNTVTTHDGNITNETAILNADTPQSETPLTPNSGQGFDVFNHNVFNNDGYVSTASKNLNIADDNTTTTTNTKGQGGYIQTDDNGYTTTTGTRTDDLTSATAGSDTTISQSLVTETPDLFNDNTYNTNGENNGTSNINREGNSDYLLTIEKARNNIINIDYMVIKSLRHLFLSIY